MMTIYNFYKSKDDIVYHPSTTILKFKGNENLKKGFETPPSEGKRSSKRKKRK